LERIFGKKEEAEEQVLSKQVFSIEDAENFLSMNFDEKSQTFKEDASKIYEEMQPVVVNMKKSLDDLVKANFNGQVDSELFQNVIAHRKSFVQKMEIMIEKIKKPMQSDLNSILEFNKSISSAISETDTKTVKDYHFLKILFEREAKKTFENFKILNKASNNFESLINNNKENLFSIRNAQSELQSIKEETGNLNQIEEHLKTLNTKLSDLKSEYDSLKEDLEKFNNDKDWLHFNKLLEKKKITEEKISSLKSQILQDLYVINKPLRKFKNLVDKGVEKIEDEKILKKCIDSTLDALIEEKNPEKIRLILEMVQKNISEGRIELKDKEKTMFEIKRILNNNLFENFLKEYILLMGDLKKLEENITTNKTLDIKNKIESQIEDIERDIEMARLEIEKGKKQEEKIKNSIKERKITLEKTLAILAKKEISINV
jgi:predicted DNA-binding protein